MTDSTTKTTAEQRGTSLADRHIAQLERMMAPHLVAEIERLRAVIRVNALRSNPALSHEEIDRVIEGR